LDAGEATPASSRHAENKELQKKLAYMILSSEIDTFCSFPRILTEDDAWI